MQGLSDSDLLIVEPTFELISTVFFFARVPRTTELLRMSGHAKVFAVLNVVTGSLAVQKKTISGFRGFLLTERWKIIGFSHPNPHHAQ